MNETETKNMIRVIEVWTPDTSGASLELREGLYGPLKAFEALSRGTRFCYGEGLPGKAWQDGAPVIFKEFTHENFIRTTAAHLAGLSSGIAIPVFADNDLRAVVVFLCGDHKTTTGAVEVWCDDGTSGMTLRDGYYGELERFEWISRRLGFPIGIGLPGRVWETGKAKVIGDFANTRSFLRAANAIEAGISAGIGIPFYSPANKTDVTAVITFLSSRTSPIAKRFEVWCADDNHDFLIFECGIEQSRDIVEDADPGRMIARNEGLIGEVWVNGVPQVRPWRELATSVEDPAKYDTLLALPVIFDGRTQSVVAFYS